LGHEYLDEVSRTVVAIAESPVAFPTLHRKAMTCPAPTHPSLLSTPDQHERRMISHDITGDLREVADAVVRAADIFSLWRNMQDVRNKVDYEYVVDTYPAFFDVLATSLLVSLVAFLYQLYETRHNARSLQYLVHKVNGQASDAEPITGASRLLSHIHNQPCWGKLATVRNEAFCHRSSKRTASQSFESVGLTVDELEVLVNTAIEVLRIISQAMNTPCADVTRETIDEFRDMMKKLSASLQQELPG
jgi:hypothetical protein